MARFRNRLRPVNSRKHVVDLQGALIIATKNANNIAKAVESTTLANVIECESGSSINSIFLNVQVAGTSTGALSNVYMYIYKNPSDTIPFADLPNGNAVGASDLKKFVFHQEMIMTEKNTTAIPRTLFKGVISIPRHMRRMGPNDTIAIMLFAPGTTYEFCIQAIYKDYA